jgi:hypothetical protein
MLQEYHLWIEAPNSEYSVYDTPDNSIIRDGSSFILHAFNTLKKLSIKAISMVVSEAILTFKANQPMFSRSKTSFLAPVGRHVCSNGGIHTAPLASSVGALRQAQDRLMFAGLRRVPHFEHVVSPGLSGKRKWRISCCCKHPVPLGLLRKLFDLLFGY